MAINIYTVQADVESHGWTLISTTYKNLKTPLELKCPKGHQISETYENWRKHHNCSECTKELTGNVQHNAFPEKPSNTYRVLALDAATGTTGYSIFDNKKLVDYGTFNSHGFSSAEKINQVKQWLIDVCKKTQPNAIGIEGIQYQKNIKIFQVLANLQGVIQDFLYENNYEYRFANSSAWRSFLGMNTGDEREIAKQQDQNYVKLMYHLNATQDESDAICIGYYFANQFKPNSKSTYNWGEDVL